MVDNITVKDAGGSNVVMRAKDVGAGVESSITIPGDASGNIAWGTAGAANANVMSVQGIASGTALHAVVDSGTLIATQATGTNLHTVVDSGTLIATQGTGTNLHTVVDSGTITTVSTVTSLSQLAGVAIDLNAGAGGAGTQRVTIDSNQVAALGQAVMASSMPVVVASNQTNLPVINGANKYVAFAAGTSITAISGGGGGATGDYLSHVIVVPATVGCGVVTITDNATAIVSFPGGGTSALSNLVPFTIPVGAVSSSGAWKMTTGANVSVVAVGKFT